MNSQSPGTTENLPGSVQSDGCSQLLYFVAVLVNGLSQLP